VAEGKTSEVESRLSAIDRTWSAVPTDFSSPATTAVLD
jgi:hypothetical protein